MIKTALISALFCVASCSDALTATLLPEGAGDESSAADAAGQTGEAGKAAAQDGSSDAAPADDAGSSKAGGAEDKAEAPKIVFKPGVGDAETPAATVPAAANLPVADWIIVDKSDRMLVLYRDGKELKRYSNIRFGDVPKGHKQFQGDEKTPEGIYTIDGRNPQSSYHLSLRISYPNNADRAYAASKGRDPGGDIFIHGQPNGYNGPPKAYDWTDGCIALSNAEMREIWQMVPDGAQIKIQQ